MKARAPAAARSATNRMRRPAAQGDGDERPPRAPQGPHPPSNTPAKRSGRAAPWSWAELPHSTRKRARELVTPRQEQRREQPRDPGTDDDQPVRDYLALFPSHGSGPRAAEYLRADQMTANTRTGAADQHEPRELAGRARPQPRRRGECQRRDAARAVQTRAASPSEYSSIRCWRYMIVATQPRSRGTPARPPGSQRGAGRAAREQATSAARASTITMLRTLLFTGQLSTQAYAPERAACRSPELARRRPAGARRRLRGSAANRYPTPK